MPAQISPIVTKISEGGAGVAAGPPGGRPTPGMDTVSPISVTAPFLAKALPCSDTPLLKEIDAKAMTFPTNEVPVPKVADVPSSQKTLEAWAWFIRTTALVVAVVSVVPIWKMNSAFGLPRAFSVSVPVN